MNAGVVSAAIAGGVFRAPVNPRVTVVMSEIPGLPGSDSLTRVG